MEYFIFKVENKNDGRRNLFGTGSLYKPWQCFRRMCAFSFSRVRECCRNCFSFDLKLRLFTY